MVQGNKVRLTWKLLYTSLPKVLLGGAFLLPVFYSRYESLELLLAEIIFSLFLLVIAIFDFQYGLIFDRLLLPLAILGLLFQIYFGADIIQNIAYGSFLGIGSLFLLRILSHNGMGYGDIKFAGVLGIWLGWDGILMALWGAFFLGGIFAAVLLLWSNRSLRDKIPFGPFLSFSAFVVFFYGQELVNLYKDWWL